ncbi:phosphoserine phosphatase SerB [Ancylostoma duodenale]|uniref:Phosphoserine phosphatase n=1 Tax=Ancylostoma duodenale TaxID=51022 RepID=A0A0C2GNW0_9BILA|nr:phosphoserine phosphatase SerB [Ancylostoma duodenale]
MIRVAARPAATALSAHAECHTAAHIETPEERTRRIWRSADAVAFDVDSTVCQDEAIDELANYLGVGEAVANVTRQAMNGNARFRHALQARLEVMRPTYDQLEAYANETKPKLTPGIRQLISALHKRGTDVYLVSGGFRRLIYPVADILGIDRKRIYANEILFDKHKNYAGFDENEPTSDSGSKDVGKPAVMGLLKKQGYKQVVMVGDGATDLEASPPADAFIGFGGNQIREAVRARADWYVTDFDVLRKALE